MTQPVPAVSPSPGPIDLEWGRSVTENANFGAAGVGGGWTSYPVAWTAGTTNPVLNNGYLSGKYRLVGNELCMVMVRIAPGSTTTFGSGQYRISLPFTAPQGAPIFMKGNALIASALYEFVGWTSTLAGSATFVSLYVSNPTASINVSSWTNTAPATFASGHVLDMAGFYSLVAV